MKRVVYFFVSMVLLGLLIQPLFALAVDEVDALNKQIAEKRAKIDLLEKSISDYKDKIQKKRLEAVSLSNQMAILDNRIAQIELDIRATEEKLATINLEIESLGLTIAEKEKSIKKQQKILAELIRSLYTEDGRSYVEIAAAYDSFSDFYSRLQYLETVECELGGSLHALQTARAELQEKHKQVSERKLAYEDMKTKLQNRRKDFNEQTFIKQNLLAQTHASELKFNTMLSTLRQQYQAIEGEISSIEKEVRKRLDAQSTLEKIAGDPTKLSWPVSSRYLTSVFHDPDYPYRNVFEHNGVDIRAGQGTPVKAAASGYIARARRCTTSSCYSYVMIVHNDGMATVYGHLSGINVSEDQFVTRGDLIGYSGGTPGTVGAGPFVTGPHLHFEARRDGIPVDPMMYLLD